ncbi:hypothetical protein [Halobacteriovorax sp.]|uniref:hypothetical protein n=1 Tax=Halobacteriovorax sp. TaxID=2020862 RepID=UPI003561DE71
MKKIMCSLMLAAFITSCSSSTNQAIKEDVNQKTEEVTNKVKKREGYCSPLDKALDKCK